MTMRNYLVLLFGFFIGCERMEIQDACPLIAYVPSHKIKVFTQIAPDKVSIDINGEEKLDECLEENSNESAPIVWLNRYSNRLEVLVQHFGAYETLPENVSLTIRDLSSCSGGDSVFFQVHDLPLEFETTHPNGVKCGSKVFADVSIEGPSL